MPEFTDAEAVDLLAALTRWADHYDIEEGQTIASLALDIVESTARVDLVYLLKRKGLELAQVEEAFGIEA